jgi:hypothetical protein
MIDCVMFLYSNFCLFVKFIIIHLRCNVCVFVRVHVFVCFQLLHSSQHPTYMLSLLVGL